MVPRGAARNHGGSSDACGTPGAGRDRGSHADGSLTLEGHNVRGSTVNAASPVERNDVAAVAGYRESGVAAASRASRTALTEGRAAAPCRPRFR